ncbi:Uncharacterised protein [BD1-7 clade bacterium]|uniref:Uncharacterized protein n=1 Tax=BD1-7 clade bacterium TaxID=2029982 RepID=A0A5S9PCN5_9GAMM|nr:Uncharacterised protein [BD1-7 clade bacterium]
MSDFGATYLPYNLPSSTQAQALRLADILDISPTLVSGVSRRDVDAMSGTILYRHLDRFQKIDVMSLLHSMPNRHLARVLHAKVVDVALVNPQWGIWSLSNEELMADQAFHAAVDELASLIGVTASVVGGKELISEVWKQRKISKASIAVVVVWGALFFNKQELMKANKEVGNRSTMGASAHY